MKVYIRGSCRGRKRLYGSELALHKATSNNMLVFPSTKASQVCACGRAVIIIITTNIIKYLLPSSFVTVLPN